MTYKSENKKGQVLVDFVIDAAEWEQEIESVYQKTKGKYSHIGFRKGHVPRKVLESVYGKGFFFEDAFNEAFPKFYNEFLEKETEVFPVDRPEIDVQSIDEQGVKFTATVTVKPEVTLGQYKDLKVEKTVAEVKPENVKAELEKMAEKNARMVVVTDRAVQNGDDVIIDYSGSVDGVKFEGGTAEKQTLTIGSGKFIPGFEEQLIGLNLNDEKDITVKFPEDYHVDTLKGKDAVFAIKVHEIKFKELPKFDDEFAKDSDFDTLAALEANITERLAREYAEKAEIKFENELISKVAKGSKVEVPNCMVERQIDSFIQEFEYTLSYQGIKLEDYVKYTNTTMEDLRKMYVERAKTAVETRLVMEEVVKVENITPDEDSINKKIEEIAVQMGKTTEEMKKTIHESEMDYIKNEVVSKKVVEFLKKVNKI